MIQNCNCILQRVSQQKRFHNFLRHDSYNFGTSEANLLHLMAKMWVQRFLVAKSIAQHLEHFFRLGFWCVYVQNIVSLNVILMQ